MTESQTDTHHDPDAWPDLQPFDHDDERPAADYPMHALGPVLGPAAQAIAELVQAPDAMAAGSVLASASLATQHLADVVLLHGAAAPLSLFIITAAESGDRKSACDQIAGHAVDELRKQQARDHIAAMQAWEAAKQSRQAGDDPAGPPPVPKAITAANATVEGLARQLKAQSSIGVFSSEGGDFLGGHSMRDERRAAGLAFFLKAWSGESLDTLRGGEGLTTLLGRRIALHVQAQPVLIHQLLTDPLAKGQGLLARCLIASPASLAGRRMFREGNPLEHPAVVAYNARITELLNTRPDVWTHGDGFELKPKRLELSPEARALAVVFHDLLEMQQAPGGELEDARPFASKALEQACRIAGVQAVIEGADAITSEVFKRAVKVVEFYLNEHLRLTGTSRTDRQNHLGLALLAWLQAHGPFVTRRQVLQSAPYAVRKVKASGIDELLTDLQRRGFIRPLGNGIEVRHVDD